MGLITVAHDSKFKSPQKGNENMTVPQPHNSALNRLFSIFFLFCTSQVFFIEITFGVCLFFSKIYLFDLDPRSLMSKRFTECRIFKANYVGCD